MRHRGYGRWFGAAGLCAAALLAACGGGYGDGGGGGNGAARLAQSHSTVLALTSDSAFVWSVNPDNDSVSLLEVANDRNRKLTEVPVGDEPRCVAITPDDKKVYVTNAVSGTVSVIDARSYNV